MFGLCDHALHVKVFKTKQELSMTVGPRANAL